METYTTVSVKFVGQQNQSYNQDKEYAFLTDLDLEVGDLVVVDTVNGYKTANITSKFGNKHKSTRWVVCVVDTEKFAEKLKELKRKQFIMTQMKQRLEEVNIIDQFKQVAKSDPEMKRLLDAFNTDISDVKELAE